ncbi:PDPFL protein, partial [Oxylabes madagascariensis]|nr:PDPFL protein [Oxylabes madagascariensis]
MASVPSAGCLLAKNQYYRSECSAGPGMRVVPERPPRLSLPSSFLSAWGAPLEQGGLPELIDKYWWVKSFFHSEPSPPAVGRKTLSAS